MKFEKLLPDGLEFAFTLSVFVVLSFSLVFCVLNVVFVGGLDGWVDLGVIMGFVYTWLFVAYRLVSFDFP